MNQTHEFAEVLSRFAQSAPVEVTELAEALGLSVWEEDDLPPGTSGRIFKDPFSGGSSGYSIGVRSADPYVRRRFTVAHEIAHFILHRDKIGSSLSDDVLYRSNLSTWEEVEANHLAADILMPRPLVNQYVKEYGSDPEFLATAFKVSEAAMRIRLGMHRTAGVS